MVVGAATTSSGGASELKRAPGVAVAVVRAGAVDVVAPSTGSLVVTVPVTLSRPLSASVRVHFHVVSGSAVQGSDFTAASGVLTIPPGRDEASFKVRILADATPSTGTCWWQATSPCRSFTVGLTMLAGGATVAPAVGEDTILPASPDAVSLSAGDASLANGDAGAARPVLVPVTLSSPQRHAVTVHFEVDGGTAIAGVNFIATKGVVKFAAGAQTRSVAVVVRLGHDTQPTEALYVKLTAPTGATVGRGTGVVLISTSAPGVPHPLDSTYGGATLTQNVSAQTSVGDSYSVLASPTPGTSQLSANPTIAGANDRMVFWPAQAAPVADQESCATWSSQSPAQGTGVITQEGLALRVATKDGVTRAITVTKNVFEYANYILNIHVWNTSRAVPFQLLKELNIKSFLMANGSPGMPWDICARVVSSTVQVELWLPGQTPPAWGDTASGGTVQLPTGWDYPGVAGWYVGHLATGATATYTNEYAGAPQSAPSL
jgi:hypothetical protein